MTHCPVCRSDIDRTIVELDKTTYKFKCKNPRCIVDRMVIWEKNIQ